MATSLDKSHQLDFNGLAVMATDVVASGSLSVAGVFLDSARLVNAGSTLSVTQALHDGKIILLNTASGSVCTLPASTGSGARFHFKVSTLATSNSHKVQVANSTDVMEGVIVTTKTDNTVTGWPTAASSDTVTLNRSTTGSVTLGEWVELVDVAAGFWSVSGQTTATGTVATPFSAAV